MRISITVTTQNTDHIACCHTEKPSVKIKTKRQKFLIWIYERLKTRRIILMLFSRRRVFGLGNFLDDR